MPSAANRAACRKLRIIPIIPRRANAKNRPSFFPKVLYKTRARVERAMGKLKRFKRVAMRCERPQTASAQSSLSLAALSWSNPSTWPSVLAGRREGLCRIRVAALGSRYEKR
jgi:Transposase DDE domain